MTKKQKEEFMGLLVQFFHEVIAPVLKENKTELKEEMKDLRHTVDRIERRLETYDDRFDRHDERLTKLEKIHPQNKHVLD
ncbi:MAG: hypothetical protein A3D24_04115 [Candidatus Blackburnbacteria bacterium RIFCSPHIGHO2_02_FULL_39_13]|uniref:Uncharacterized protein n=1 Tax=Candidatus Blackburnbacteria bacterium RIFCSPLOWO2_01_FULL_40_20 TaxID=1797519 RepID=A0A1G1VAL4_9BACT|nr:MAG: hypothetical protein A2694_02690 [Candidatus Blackburnbacteria bacterium RIFCSPHIGHO2_01_FULL_40_17]OGY08416.1 MAG: hypothetical protein A3D24_04115 [Candidatus Blackburnbacteria bacterium RIFCSPHIGHO2_02_FULL_39_13]OGY12488.1 MAG: hypothetical protein A3A77_00745 [Candidatus Blackburnbacteria bacterium RIFCSPLOWO2_01_FULL_40_20]